jgi:hypothetical protein
MKRTGLTVAVVAVALFAAACFTHSYTVGSGGNTNNSPAYSHWHGHWIFGWLGNETVNVSSICPSGNATIEDEHTFVNLIVAALIGELYYPTTVNVYCDGRTASLQLTPEQLRAIGRAPEMLSYVHEVWPQAEERVAMAVRADEAGLCSSGLAAR